jgi:hypothetical protein
MKENAPDGIAEMKGAQVGVRNREDFVAAVPEAFLMRPKSLMIA